MIERQLDHAAAIVALTVTREIRDMMIGDSEWMLLHPTFAVWLREEHALLFARLVLSRPVLTRPVLTRPVLTRIRTTRPQ